MSKKLKPTSSNRSVNFSASAVIESSISVVKNPESIFDVYVGFLKVYHKYEIKFSVPNEIGLTKNYLSSSIKSVGFAVKEISFQGKNISIVLEYTCELKEGVLAENFTLQCDKTNKKLEMVLHLEVLGKNQGTPSLKTGVKCIERLRSDETDYSDYQD